MRRIHLFIAVAAVGGLISGCASEQRSLASEASTLNKPIYTNTPRESSSTAELRGETATAYGDDHTAVNLLERAEAERDTPLNEFNLAAAYARTGRPLEAIAFYRRVIVDGTHEEVFADNIIGGSKKDVRFNLSSEAQVRAAMLEASLKPGERDAKDVSNARAIQLDKAAVAH